MTLRDIGSWFGSVWDQVVSDLQIVISEPPLDWPLWVFPVGLVVIFILVPVALGKILFEARSYIENEPPMGLGWCIGFTVGTVLCAMVLVDLYATERIFDEEDVFMYIAYPLMTVFFGSFAIVEWRKQLKVWRGRK